MKVTLVKFCDFWVTEFSCDKYGLGCMIIFVTGPVFVQSN